MRTAPPPPPLPLPLPPPPLPLLPLLPLPLPLPLPPPPPSREERSEGWTAETRKVTHRVGQYCLPRAIPPRYAPRSI